MTTQTTFPTQGIQNLLLNRKGDRSYDRLARDTGGALTGKRLQQLATTPMLNFPDPASIKGLAKALQSTNKEVLHACAESMGIEVAGEQSTTLELPGARTLPASSQELLLAMSEEMQELNQHSEVVAS